MGLLVVSTALNAALISFIALGGDGAQVPAPETDSQEVYGVGKQVEERPAVLHEDAVEVAGMKQESMIESSCVPRLAACLVQLEEIKSKKAAGRRPSDEFAGGEADEELTAMFERHMAELLRSVGLSENDFVVECRARVCRLVVSEAAGMDPNDWSEAIHSDDAMRQLLSGVEARAGRKVVDPETGDSMVDYEMYFRVAERGVVAANRFLAEVMAGFVSSAEYRSCVESFGEGFGEAGSLGVVAALSQGAISFRAEGSLAEEPVARCLLEAASRIADSVRPPAEAGDGTYVVTVADGLP